MGSMNMEGMGWMAGAMGLVTILTVVALVLLIAALVKYLFFGSSSRGKHED